VTPTLPLLLPLFTHAQRPPPSGFVLTVHPEVTRFWKGVPPSNRNLFRHQYGSRFSRPCGPAANRNCASARATDANSVFLSWRLFESQDFDVLASFL
jgi:hypothetical protein